MNWLNIAVLILRSLLMGLTAYLAANGQAEAAAGTGGLAGAMTVNGGYLKPM